MAVGEFAYTDKMVRLGVISDMAQRLLGADDLSLKFSGTVSDERLDARSLLSLKLEGATRKLALGNTIGIGGLEVRSSQSFMRTEFLLNSAWRWNDIRGYRPEKYPSKFVTLDKCGASMTFDLGFETGWTIYGNVKHARLTKFPDDELPERFVFRPLARLNFTKDRILGDSVALSGNITGWYVNRGWSGLDIGSTFAERAELSLVYEGNGFEVGFSVTAGRNPISNFDRIAPEYGLKIQFK